MKIQISIFYRRSHFSNVNYFVDNFDVLKSKFSQVFLKLINNLILFTKDDNRSVEMSLEYTGALAI